MPKISELASATALDTDMLPVQRGGSTLRVELGDLVPALGLGPILAGGRHEAFHAGVSSGNSAALTYRVFRPILGDQEFAQSRLTFLSQGIGTTAGATLNANSHTLEKCAIVVGGVVQPVTFFEMQERGFTVTNNGRSIVVPPGRRFQSDPLPRTLKSPGYFIHCRVTGTATGGSPAWTTWPTLPTQLHASLGEGYSSTDFVDTAAPAGLSTGVGGYAPAIVVAKPRIQRRPSVAIIGSSSGFGQGDTVEAPHFVAGYLSRALATAELPFTRLSVSGDRIEYFLADWSTRRRLIEINGFSHVLWQLGSNDITAGASLATLQARCTQAWDFMHGLGLKVLKTNVTPLTNASNVPVATAAVRTSFNAWLATAEHPAVVGFIDASTAVQDGSDATKWRSDGGVAAWTNDGTHLTQLGHQTVAAAILSTIQAIA